MATPTAPELLGSEGSAGAVTGAGVVIPDPHRPDPRESSMMAYLFPSHALPPAVRARIELLRDRASSPAGWIVTCGGSSMEPVLVRGDRVVIRARPPQRGLVAAFVTGRGDLELHRLVAAAPGGWWAHLGDNQVDPSPGLVHASQIVGVAELPVRVPRAVERARALARFAQAAVRLARRRLHPR